uniref:Uncharacterized protein n=1 Tax=viral metagenome TaxID=1070528 RepID=A0A6C0K9A3_9ZZZZ
MSNYLLYIIGFLLGIFLLLIIITDKGDIRTLFKNTKEYFANAATATDADKDKDKDKIYDESEIVKVSVVPPPILKEVITKNDDDPVASVLTNSEIIDNFKFNKLLKKREMRVLVSSYNNDNLNKNDWITDNKNYNNNIMLKLDSSGSGATDASTSIIKEFNNLNPFVNGYNIHEVSIRGPPNAVMYKQEKTLGKFSVLFMFSHKRFHKNKNNLFIIYGVDNKNIVINIKDNEYNNNNYYNVNNDPNDNSDLNGAYDKNDINKSINLLNNFHYYENHDILSNKAKEQKSYKLSYFEKLYTVEIIIDDSVYNINDINMETLKRDITFFGLIMDKEDVVFHLNNTKYEFKRNTDRDIKIGKESFVINKDKSCEIVLYSFAFFTEAISDADLKTFKLYNKYKLYGIHNKEEEVPANDKKALLSNIDIKMPQPLVMKDVADTEVNTIVENAAIPDIKDIPKI